MLETEFINWVI